MKSFFDTFDTYDRNDVLKYPTFLFFFRRYAPFDTFGGASPTNMGQRFEGDHRTGPSVSPTASARTYGCVFFNLDGVFYKFSGSTGTTVNTLLFGKISATAKVSSVVTQSAFSQPSNFTFAAKTSGSMPLFPGAPNIDTQVVVRVTFTSRPRQIWIGGEAFGDNFPNLEVFLIGICGNGSVKTALLLDGRTTGGRDLGPVTRLYTTHSDFSLGRFASVLPLNEKGEFASNHTVGPRQIPDYSPDPLSKLLL
jgi:hypothetical protein